MIKRVVRGVARKAREPILKFVFDNLMEGSAPGRKPFGAEELRLLREALLSQNLFGQDGTMVPRFEKEFAVAYGVPHAIASTSGTAAIHVALGALDLEPGDEIITAPITDLGTIIPIISQGAIPVFADVDGTYNMTRTSSRGCLCGGSASWACFSRTGARNGSWSRTAPKACV